VRTWVYNGSAVTPLAGAGFFAYNTKKFGVNVSSGDIDTDPRDEFLSGAGPGAVFGPHVRAFNFDGGAIQPETRVSFFAYGTRKFGVNVKTGDVDGDGHDEILTGPGPALFFGPHIRGWNFDGDTLKAISKINYFAYGNRKYGARLAAGDMDQDGYDEIITGPGPGSMLGPNVTGWDYDNNQISRINSMNFMAYPSGTRYGVDVAAGQFL
jgi:hypothetical protein